MFCPKCGNEVQEGSAFCGKCGAPVASAPGRSGATGAAAEIPGASAPKRSGAKIGVIVAGVVVVLLVVVGFVANGFGLGGVQSKEAVDVPAASQGQQAEGSEEVTENPDGGSVNGQDAVGGSAQDAAAGATVKSAVEAYTWDELSQISAEIAAAGDEAAGIEVAKKYNLCTSDGKLDGTQVKSVTLVDGTQTTVQIIGFNHDDKTDGGKAGITFILGSAVTDMMMNSSGTNAGGWEASQPRAYLNSDGIALMPQELTDKIVAVDKLTNNVGETEDVSSVSITSDKLWLPSATELCGTVSWNGKDSSYAKILNAEGAEYKLYRDTAVDPDGYNDILIKGDNGEACYWWERSACPNGSYYFLTVGSNGSAEYGDYSTESRSVVPCFCI